MEFFIFSATDPNPDWTQMAQPSDEEPADTSDLGLVCSADGMRIDVVVGERGEEEEGVAPPVALQVLRPARRHQFIDGKSTTGGCPRGHYYSQTGSTATRFVAAVAVALSAALTLRRGVWRLGTAQLATQALRK